MPKSTHRRRVLAAAASATAVALFPAFLPAGAAASAPACAGAAGIGDPYFPTYGNGGYDVGHYDLAVRYAPETDRLTGTATIHAAANDDLCRLNLDFVGMTVRSVTVDGRAARWSRGKHELRVTPQRRLRDGRAFTLVVRYDGVPQSFAEPGSGLLYGPLHTDDGLIIAGEPEGAAFWFPVNDHPLDKASYTFRVTAPKGLQVIANGLPAGSYTRRGWTTSTWQAAEPMTSYLATVNVDGFDVHRWATEDGVPVIDAVHAEITGSLRDNIDSSLARQGEIVDALEKRFGPYPFTALGGIVHEGFPFALETQTRSVYSTGFWPPEPNPDYNFGDSVVVHELAHQWYGDDVALERWQDIWLNEGFASYAEWLWAVEDGLAPSVQDIFDDIYAAIPAEDPFWALAIGDPGADRLFDGAVYTRGALTLQALRAEVGDRAFFRILRQWAQRNTGGHGTTPEFVALAEQISGRQLDRLFHDWLFTAAKPPARRYEAEVAGGTAADAAASTAADGSLAPTSPASWATAWLEHAREHPRHAGGH